MHIDVIDAAFQTALFIAFLIGIVVLTARIDQKPHEMNHSHTNEIKGIAILMVLFSHIGYFLFSDHKFLYPLSVAGGVGVNIFLFLSGFGLASSELKSPLTIFGFYKKRLKNIFVPMWFVLFLTLLLDYFLLNKTYPAKTIIQNTLGFFPNSDIGTAINSPLWYFSLILFYYLLFPLVYSRRRYLLSASLFIMASFILINVKLPFTVDLAKLYRVHFLAFPLGLIFAHLYNNKPGVVFKEYLLKLTRTRWPIYIVSHSLIILLMLLIATTAIHSGIGENPIKEQLMSMVTVLSLILIVLLKELQSKLLILLGTYSYEIYLIQWPILYRHDFIYKYTPAFLGTLLYLAFFISVGFVMNKLVKILLRKRNDVL